MSIHNTKANCTIYIISQLEREKELGYGRERSEREREKMNIQGDSTCDKRDLTGDGVWITFTWRRHNLSYPITPHPSQTYTPHQHPTYAQTLQKPPQKGSKQTQTTSKPNRNAQMKPSSSKQVFSSYTSPFSPTKLRFPLTLPVLS
jgi:hypothetical protein